MTFLDTYRMFDGVDFDWEYPGGAGEPGTSAAANDGQNCAALLALVRTTLDALGAGQGRRYEISVASPAGLEKIAQFNLAGLTPSVDFFNLMAYDFHGTWESKTGHQSAFTGDPAGYDVQTAVRAYLAAGVPAGKAVLGAPLYTRAWGGVAAGGDGGYAAQARGDDVLGHFERRDGRGGESGRGGLRLVGARPGHAGDPGAVVPDPLTLESLAGKVVVLHFYACGCINCIRNQPTYAAWQERYRDQDVVLLGIHTPETAAEQDPAHVRKQAAAALGFPVLIDNAQANWNAWGNSMWPAVYLIDKQGYLRHFWPGELKWQGATGDQWMQKRIDALLAEPAAP